MTGLGKKPMVTTGSAETRFALLDLSKAALADLVVDLVRRSEGANLDGHDLLVRVVRAAEPVLMLRGDPVPKSHLTRGLPGSAGRRSRLHRAVRVALREAEAAERRDRERGEDFFTTARERESDPP